MDQLLLSYRSQRREVHDAVRLAPHGSAQVASLRQQRGEGESGKRRGAPWLAAERGPGVRQVTRTWSLICKSNS